MKITKAGILVVGEPVGWRLRDTHEHDWADRPLVIPREGRKDMEWHGPVAGGSRQYFIEPMAPIMPYDQTAIAGTTEAAMWPVSPWSALVANQLQPGQVYRISAGGVMTVAGSAQGTLTITPRWGTTTAGTSFGASVASATMTAGATNVPWFLEALLMARSAGPTATAVMNGRFTCDQAGISNLGFGGPITTIDTTTPQGFWFGATMGSASDTLTTRQLLVEIVN